MARTSATCSSHRMRSSSSCRRAMHIRNTHIQLALITKQLIMLRTPTAYSDVSGDMPLTPYNRDVACACMLTCACTCTCNMQGNMQHAHVWPPLYSGRQRGRIRCRPAMARVSQQAGYYRAATCQSSHSLYGTGVRRVLIASLRRRSRRAGVAAVRRGACSYSRICSSISPDLTLRSSRLS